MTEPDFRGGADRNPQLSGVDLDHKPTLKAGRFDFRGGAEKVVVHVHPRNPLDWRPWQLHIGTSVIMEIV